MSDLTLPGMDGCELLGRLRGLAGGAHRGRLQALALTAWAGEAARGRALAAGFDRCLPKPFEVNDLLRTVAELAGRAEEASRG